MTSLIKKLFRSTTAVAIAALAATPVLADDTDLFNPPPSFAAADIPNVIFVLHNPNNWNNQSQHFSNGLSTGANEAAAMAQVIGAIHNPVNVGIVEHTANGGFVRMGLRPVGDDTIAHATNRTNVVNMLNTMSSDIGNETSLGPNSVYSANALYETLRYLQGAASTYSDNYNQGSYSQDYPNNTAFNNSTYNNQLRTNYAYASSANGAMFTPPTLDACAKTYIIFMATNQNQYFAQPSASDPSVSVVPLSASSGLAGMEVAWARYLYKSKGIVTYSLDLWNAQQNIGMTTGLKQMASYGGGRYFSTTTQQDIAAALTNIFSNIQAVNSVFASSSLPVSVNVRGTYLNQVYMGVFRPDQFGRPNWAGNLKQYKLGVDTTTSPPALFLADSLGNAAENPSTGFTTPTSVSFWTRASTFWNALFYPNAQGQGGPSDSPDGDLVEKGGAAQDVRTRFAAGPNGSTAATTRNVYTCTGTCTAGSSLSAYKFDTNNSSITTSLLGAISTADSQSIINWIRGANTTLDDDPTTPQSATNIRGYAHGDVLHSRPAIVNYGNNKLMVYYGSNDGMIHAVQGGQDTTTSGTHPVADGTEMWSLVLPEHFSQLKKLRDHAPIVSVATPHPKPYFADGSFSVYQSTTADGVIDYTRGDKAYLFVTMRRGGNFMYALDVSNPVDPKLLWKRTQGDNGFGELGMTWSEPRIAKVKGITNPVIIMGLGYDAAANDTTPATTASKGRGVIVIDAFTGTALWQAGRSPSNATTNLTVPGMLYSVASNVALLDSDGDGYIDRAYVGDTGGNIWRVDLDDGTASNPAANWTVNKLASLGGTGANARRFLFQPDVVPASTTNPNDILLIGSGDRENPFDTTVTNRFYMLEDNHAKNSIHTTMTETDLVDVTSAAPSTTPTNGWYITLGSGEKVVSSAATLNGTVFFGTNVPQTQVAGACTPSLGEARLYSINYLTGWPTLDNTGNGGALTVADRYEVRVGGGYPPSPVLVSVQINGQTYQAAISGAQVLSAPGITINRRTKTYWFKKGE
jgi:type IV pilus assembly protein PilY1